MPRCSVSLRDSASAARRWGRLPCQGLGHKGSPGAPAEARKPRPTGSLLYARRNRRWCSARRSPPPVGEGWARACVASVEIRAQAFGGRFLAQLGKGAVLHLAGALARHAQAAAHLFERVGVAVRQAEAQLEHELLALG